MTDFLKKTITARGFDLANFDDHNGESCSLQKSSSALDDCIWLGVNDADPKIKATDAAAMGLTSLLQPGQPVVGWVPFPLPEQVLLSTRMHLTREQVAQLIPALQYFVDNGDLP